MTTHYDRDTLIDYLHGALDPETDARVFTHLQTCAPCNALHDEEAALSEALRLAARADERELPAMVRARVWDAVRREKPSWAERLRAGWGPRLALPVAAAAALALYFGVPAFHSQQAAAAGIQAAYYLDEHNAEAQQNPFGPGMTPAVYSTDAQDRSPSTAATYIDTADAATLDDASGAGN